MQKKTPENPPHFTVKNTFSRCVNRKIIDAEYSFLRSWAGLHRHISLTIWIWFSLTLKTALLPNWHYVLQFEEYFYFSPPDEIEWQWLKSSSGRNTSQNNIYSSSHMMADFCIMNNLLFFMLILTSVGFDGSYFSYLVS